MHVTLSGIVTLVRDVHSEKARSPMLVTLFGIVTLVRDEQSQLTLPGCYCHATAHQKKNNSHTYPRCR